VEFVGHITKSVLQATFGGGGGGGGILHFLLTSQILFNIEVRIIKIYIYSPDFCNHSIMIYKCLQLCTPNMIETLGHIPLIL
jgi:hypothetical protein